MRFANKLVGMLIAGATIAAVPACRTTGRASLYYDNYTYDEPPPPPQEEVAVYRPGFVWVHGTWWRDHNRWAWRGGYYTRERAGYVYEPGRWERDGSRYHYRDGTWRARGGVVIRRRY